MFPGLGITNGYQKGFTSKSFANPRWSQSVRHQLIVAHLALIANPKAVTHFKMMWSITGGIISRPHGHLL